MRALTGALVAWAVAVLGSAGPGSADATSGARQAAAFAGMLDEHPVIQYASRPTHDPVARLNAAISTGRAVLAFEPGSGYLRSVLRGLGVSESSQLLVFAKTGIQRNATSSRNPRAIYFGRSVVVGYIAGARVIELAAHDPEQGVVFYTLDQAPTPAPAFARRTQCLTCHVSASTLDVPGMIVRSHTIGTDGELVPLASAQAITHRTPLTERWGGWFVTGTYAAPPYGIFDHQGNVQTTLGPEGAPRAASNEVFIEWMNSAPETRGYLSPDSDLASLLVFDHQMHAINLLTRLGWESRVAIAEGRLDVSQGVLRPHIDALADYLLFVGEEPPPGQVTPRPGFAERLRADLPVDARGRSLGDLDLHRRLQRYPLSFMIYTDAFEHLPQPTKQAVYARLSDVVSGRDTRPAYAHLSHADRRAVDDILRATKPDWPDRPLIR